MGGGGGWGGGYPYSSRDGFRFVKGLHGLSQDLAKGSVTEYVFKPVVHTVEPEADIFYSRSHCKLMRFHFELHT